MTRVLRRFLFGSACAAIGACAVAVAWAQNAGQVVPTVLSSDLFEIIRNGTPSVTYTTLGNIRDGRFYVYNVPLTGDTLTVTNAQSAVSLNPAGDISALTVNLPATTFDGKIVTVFSTKAITTLTLQTQNTATITAPVTTLAAAGTFGYIFSLAANTWYRID